MPTAKSATLKAQLHRFDDAEMVLIRAGQHLFLEWRAKGRSDNTLQASYECIWQRKRELRASKRELLGKMRPVAILRRSRA
jgi:hypothetical protein